MTSFIDWFKTDGDKLCSFVALASIGVKATDGLPANVTTAMVIASVIATAAHQCFFATPSQENSK